MKAHTCGVVTRFTSFPRAQTRRPRLRAALLAALLAAGFAPNIYAARCGAGGYTSPGNCLGNTSKPPKVTIENDDLINGSAYGKYSATGSATGAAVHMACGDVTGDVEGGRSEDRGDGASANGNSVNIECDRGIATVAGTVRGGYSIHESSKNEVRILGNVFAIRGLVGNVLGGDGDTASENTVTLSRGVQTKSVWGGRGWFTAKKNRVTLEMHRTVVSDVCGGYGAQADENEVSITAPPEWGYARVSSVTGGYGTFHAIGNRVSITGDVNVRGTVTGGGGADGWLNTVTIGERVKVSGDVLGGDGGGDRNKVTIERYATVSGNVYGAKGEDVYTSSNNIVTVRGSVNGSVWGGYAKRQAAAKWNTVTISGGTVGGVVYGSDTPTATGNRLNTEGKNLDVGGVANFATININLPGDVANSTVLQITGSDPVDLTGVTINVTGAALAAGENITLINKATGTPAALTGLPTGYTHEVNRNGRLIIRHPSRASTSYSITIDPSIANGEVICNGGDNAVAAGSAVECTGNADTGFKFKTLVISDGGATRTCPNASLCRLPDVKDNVTVTAEFEPITPTSHDTHHAITYAVTGSGSISCDPNPVPDDEIVFCDASPAPGYELTDVSSLPRVEWHCNLAAGVCITAAGVTEPLEVRATFTAIGGGIGDDDNSSPAMGELGLLLSGLALAGAAAPALRRREKQGKKSDTHR